MRIRIVVPGDEQTLSGNWRTARRWAELLRAAGHAVQLLNNTGGARQASDASHGSDTSDSSVPSDTSVPNDASSQDRRDGESDVLVALHARRSHPAILDSRKRWPHRPVVVALTGTDLYHDLLHDDSAEVRESLALSSAIVVLQEQAATQLPAPFQARARVIYQSAQPFTGDPQRDAQHFRVLVVANLRAEKDALRPALAARNLPAESRLQVVLVGSSLDPDHERAARQEMDTNARFEWLGYRPYAETRALLAGANLVVIPSRIEGSSNVLSEAVVDGVPLLAARIPGLLGTLGSAYPGYFSPGHTDALSALLARAEADPGFVQELTAAGERVRPRLEPAAESAAWEQLLAHLDMPVP